MIATAAAPDPGDGDSRELGELFRRLATGDRSVKPRLVELLRAELTCLAEGYGNTAPLADAIEKTISHFTQGAPFEWLGMSHFLAAAREVMREHAPESSEISELGALLRRLADGDRTAEARLFELLYAELRRIAQGYLRSERSGHTLQPTALINEAFMRLSQNQQFAWKNKNHFLAMAAKVMRRILVDYGRSHNAGKRGAQSNAIPIEFAGDIADPRESERSFLPHLHEALNNLEAIDPECARIVEMRFFGGMTEEAIAEVLGCSSRTVKRKWQKARAMLRQELES